MNLLLTGMVLADLSIGQGVGILVPTFTAVGIAVAGFVVQQSRSTRARIDSLALDVRTLQTQVAPFWSSLQTKIADSLHNPDEKSAALDALLEKLEALDLTPEEQIVLEAMLQAIVNTGSPDLAAKAKALLSVMKMKVLESAGELPDTDQRSMQSKKDSI